jgi:hypothetical protein
MKESAGSTIGGANPGFLDGMGSGVFAAGRGTGTGRVLESGLAARVADLGEVRRFFTPAGLAVEPRLAEATLDLPDFVACR